ncbi:hypothetical protein SDC9_22779 [bioreactor metagenome]|jgi:hypothetical protein|uniref:Uncharacterized protein n=1 Tax=bioreactor metagenome TaxID=1076179 RepID=A0A644UD64_9ZZZZ
MDITNLIIGIVSFVLGIIMLVWFIKKPIKFHEDPKDNMGADDIVQHENLNKSWNQEAIIAFVGMIILGIIFIYKGITGV